MSASGEELFKTGALEFYEWCEKQAEKPGANAKELVLKRVEWMLSNMYEKGAIQMRTSLLETISKSIGSLQEKYASLEAGKVGASVQKVAALTELRSHIERTGG